MPGEAASPHSPSPHVKWMLCQMLLTSRNRPHKYLQLIFDKGVKAIHGDQRAFSTNGTGAI